jgi:hypothetical protein
MSEIYFVGNFSPLAALRACFASHFRHYNTAEKSQDIPISHPSPSLFSAPLVNVNFEITPLSEF